MAAVDLAVELPRHILVRQATFLRPLRLRGLHLLFLLFLLLLAIATAPVVVTLVTARPLALGAIVLPRGADLLVHPSDNSVKFVLVFPYKFGCERVVHLDELFADPLGANCAQVDAWCSENLPDEWLVAFDISHSGKRWL